MKFKAQYKASWAKAEGNSHWKVLEAESKEDAWDKAVKKAKLGYRLITLKEVCDEKDNS